MLSEENILAAATCNENEMSSKTPLDENLFEEPPIFHLSKGDAYLSSYGQIILTTKHLLVLHCKFCQKKYDSINNFMQHLKFNHALGRNKEPLENCVEAKTNAEPHNDTRETQDSTNFDIEVRPKFVKDDTVIQKLEIVVEEIDGNIIEEEIDGNIMEEEKDFPSQNENCKTDNEMDDYEESSGNESNNADNKKVYAQKCNKCSIVFRKKSAYNNHLLSHATDKKYSCTLCERIFKYKNNLSQHIKKHTAEKKHVCDVCDKRFFTRSELTVHKRIHTGDKPYVCLQCGSAFLTYGALASHTRRRHDNIRKENCYICEWSFKDKSDLIKHMKVHSNERPFVCIHCSATFKRKYHLELHNKLHINAMEYTCYLCDKKYNIKSTLNNHLKNIHNILEKL